jgi:poly(A) polymerase
MEALQENTEIMALFVGGCVRNTVLGLQDIGDIDIATRWTPQQVTKRLEQKNIKVIPTGIEHGTVTAVLNKKHFEITTLRRDVKTDGRRAVVAFADTWREDAQRRDFTMNTLLANADGHIFDPTGRGLSDLAAGKVRFVGEAKTRIAEDHLRILRFFRFHALYGQGQPDAAALKACAASARFISKLSKERITQEVFRILSVENPEHVLSLMFKNNILKGVLGVKFDPVLFRHVCEFQNRFGLAFIASRLLTLAGLNEKNIEKFEKLLLIPNVFKKDIKAISEVLTLPDLGDDYAVKVAVYKCGRLPTAQALMIELAQDRVMNGYAPKALKIIQKWDIPQLPVDGNDLMKAGIKKGPELGRTLEKLEDWWIEQGFKPDRDAVLKHLLAC